VRLPSLFVGATEEIFASPKQVAAMDKYIPDLEVAIIEDCGHWTQQEKPQELNEVMLDWLARRYPAK
jgi:soluble epoxide hydrolase/lipid-phosphate phosphatase